MKSCYMKCMICKLSNLMTLTCSGSFLIVLTGSDELCARARAAIKVSFFIFLRDVMSSLELENLLNFFKGDCPYAHSRVSSSEILCLVRYWFVASHILA